jgi:hypothetical protein
MADKNKFRNSEAHRFVRTPISEDTDIFYKFQDPTFFGFKPMFNFNRPFGLLASEQNKNSALAYLIRIGDNVRAEYMRAFIKLLRDISIKSAWYFRMIEGLEDAWKRDYMKPVLVDKKIAIGCMESLDLRMTAMIDLYRKACFDWINRREVVPSNLRKFEVSIYVYDFRVFNDFGDAKSSVIAKKRQEQYILFGNKSNDFEYTDDLNIGRTTNRNIYHFKECEFDTNESSEHLTKVDNTTYEAVTQKIAFSYFDMYEENVYNMFLTGKVSDFTIKAIEQSTQQFNESNFIDNTYNTPNNTQFAPGQSSPATGEENLGKIAISSGNDNRYKQQAPEKLSYLTNIFDIENPLSLVSFANGLASEIGGLFLQNVFDENTFNAITSVNDNITVSNQNVTQTTTDVIEQNVNINPVVSILDFIQSNNQNVTQITNDIIDQTGTNITNNVNENITLGATNNTVVVNELISSNNGNETDVVNDSIDSSTNNSVGIVSETIQSNVTHPLIDLDIDLSAPNIVNDSLDFEILPPPIIETDLSFELSGASNETGVVDENITIPRDIIIEKIESPKYATNNPIEKVSSLDLKEANIQKVDLAFDLGTTNNLTDGFGGFELNVPSNKVGVVIDFIEQNTNQMSGSLELNLNAPSNNTNNVNDILNYNTNNIVGKSSDNVFLMGTNNPIEKTTVLNFFTDNKISDLSGENILGNTNNKISDDVGKNEYFTNNKTDILNLSLNNETLNISEYLKKNDVVDFKTFNEVEKINEIINNSISNNTEFIDLNVFDASIQRTETIVQPTITVTNNAVGVTNDVIDSESRNDPSILSVTEINTYTPNLINPEDTIL